MALRCYITYNVSGYHKTYPKDNDNVKKLLKVIKLHICLHRFHDCVMILSVKLHLLKLQNYPKMLCSLCVSTEACNANTKGNYKTVSDSQNTTVSFFFQNAFILRHHDMKRSIASIDAASMNNLPTRNCCERKRDEGKNG